MAKNIHEINIKVEGNAWESALTKSFKKAVQNAKIDGFRKGKAPRELFEKKYGKESLYMDAVDFALEDAYKEALEKSNLTPITKPTIDIKEINEKGVEFMFTITTKPEVKLGKYKNLGVKKPDIKVTKEEIEHEIEHMREHYAEISEKEGKIENGNIAIIDFEGFKENIAFEGGKGENYSLEIGSNTFIPGFEEQLIGHSKGEEFDVNVTFPEEYHSEELKGQPVVFKIKVNEVKERVIPELNEDFYSDLGLEGVTSKEDLENIIKENLEARKNNDEENKYIDELLKAAAKDVEVELPKELVDEEIERMIAQYSEQLKMQGVTLDQFYNLTNSTEEMLKEQMTKEAENRVLYRFMLEEIANKENIEITDEEANSQAETMAKNYNIELNEFLNMFGGLDMMKYDMKMRKTIELLKENN